MTIATGMHYAHGPLLRISGTTILRLQQVTHPILALPDILETLYQRENKSAKRIRQNTHPQSKLAMKDYKLHQDFRALAKALI